MDKAIDNYIIGKQVEVHAQKGMSVPASSRRYMCPCCLEYVALDIRGHFRHKTKTSQSIECERRVSGNAVSIYERIGVPFYLLEQSPAIFELYLEFPSLPPNSICNTNAVDNSIIITTTSGRVAKYNCARFSKEKGTLLKMDYSPGEGSYYFEFGKSVGTTAKQTITNHSDRFGDGAFFKISEKMSRKVRRGGTIAMDTNYYFVGNTRYFLHHSRIAVEMCGNIIFNDAKRTVYKICIKGENISEWEYKQLSSTFASVFKLNLVHRDSQLVAIWPPALTYDSKVVFDDYTRNAHFLIDSPNDTPKVFQFTSQSYEEKRLPSMDPNYFTVPIFSARSFFAVDKAYNANIQEISKQKLYTSEKEYDYDIVDEAGTSIIEGQVLAKVNKQYRITTNFAGFVLKMRKGTEPVLMKIASIEGILINNTKRGDIIEIYSKNWNLVYRYAFVSQPPKGSDEYEYAIMQQLNLQKRPFVPLNQEDILIFSSVPQESILFPVVQRYLLSRQCPQKAKEIIKHYLRRIK